jgi:hypothetical protein
MLYSSQEEAVADSYFSFANDVAGILAISLAATALQFEHPQPFANFFSLLSLYGFLASAMNMQKSQKAMPPVLTDLSATCGCSGKSKYFSSV